MFRKILFILFVLIGTGSGFGQYLKFEEVAGLLDVADDREEAVKYLEELGYEYNDEEEETEDEYTIEYVKTVNGQDYFIRLVANLDLDVYTAALFTRNGAAWEYYTHYMAKNDYDLVDTQKKKGGILIYDYEGDYDVSMGSYPEDDGKTLYKIIISIY